MAHIVRGILVALTLVCATSTFAQEAPDFDIRLTGVGSGVQKIEDGFSLLYRPHLVSKTEWSGGKLTFTWEPPKLPEKAADGRIYGDHLIVFLSSDGSFRKERSYEVKTGVAVRFDSTNGDVTICTAVDGESFDVLKTMKGSGPVEGPTPVVISDVNDIISVSVDKEFVSAAVPKEARKGKVWGLYNREPVANARNITKIFKVSYKP